ncbi:MAG: FAD:protein FMN transferase [Lachnospiraceae bacterium]|nr:FAD:protein FMN transferase [Lachnospiraceae bacterium]
MKRACKRLVILFTATWIILTGCTKNENPYAASGFYFDTAITVTIYEINGKAPSAQEAETIISDCFTLCDRYENLLSASISSSDIAKINAAGGKPVTVSEETADLLKEAISYSKQSDGRFDVTVGPLVSLWDFSSSALKAGNEHRVPTADQIAEAISHVDYRKIRIENNTVTLSDPNASIELGAIAKGFIADKLTELVRSKNVTSALINLGGNLVAIGNKPNGNAWQLGIKKPFSESGEIITSLSVTDASLVTSGIYERCFEAGGRRYHHLLNAETGYPEDNTLASVTILCPSSMRADALSTVCYLLGEQKGMELINSLPDAEAVFVRCDESLLFSSGLTK